MTTATTTATWTLPALTVHQPWTWCQAAGHKPIENRGWPTKHRGPLALHSSRTWDTTGGRDPRVLEVIPPHLIRRTAAGQQFVQPHSLLQGSVLAVVDLVDCHRDQGCCRPWGQPGAWHWVLDPGTLRRLPHPHPVTGRQRLWKVAIPLLPAPTADTVTAAIRRHRYHYAHETGLQTGVTEALRNAGLPARREVQLSPRDRLDVLSGAVAVEVKVGGTADAAFAQLCRYATHDRVRALVLVTTLNKHRAMPEQACGKPLTIVHLGGAA